MNPLRRVAAAWRRQIGFRLVAVVFGLSLVLGAVASYYSYRSELAERRDHLTRFGLSMARAAALACPDAILTADTPLLEQYVDDLTMRDPLVAFAWVERDADGRVLASTPRLGRPLPTGETVKLAAPIRVSQFGDQIGSFVLGMSMAQVHEALRSRTMVLFLQSTLTCMLVAIGLLLVLRAFVIEPLRRLDAAALRLSHGDLATEVADFGENELGRLGATMETMRRNLARNHEALAAQNLRLRELDRLKSQFLANMSHEIRTPLSCILGSIDLLTVSDLDAEDRVQAMDALRWNGEHLLDLVNTLLDSSKIETGHLLVENIACRTREILGDVVAGTRPLSDRKQLYLRVAIDEAVPEFIMTDPVRLRQVLINVLGNAVKFTAQGGVELRARILDPGSKQRLEIRVTDTGIGIEPEFLRRIFEPFSQADGSTTRRYGGTGLGLSIAHRLAHALGGDITVESEVGRGTTMIITVAATQPEQPTASERPEATPSRMQGRVLLVDDALDNQRLMKAMLERMGPTVDTADDGKMAIEMVTEAGARGAGFDLILMDLQMPEMDGLTAIRWLRQHGYETPIVALTAHAMEEDRDNALAVGANAYETKPISRQRLQQVLAVYLQAVAAPAGAE